MVIGNNKDFVDRRKLFLDSGINHFQISQDRNLYLQYNLDSHFLNIRIENFVSFQVTKKY